MVETFTARTACDARKMRKTCAEALSGPLRHLSPRLCENCARTPFAQFLRNKWVFLHNFLSPLGLKLGVSCAQFLHNFRSQAQSS